jgi:REP element-mobilizing transposase RayT
MSRTRYQIYDNQAPHFLTCTVVNWLPLFSSPAIVDILYASWRFLQAQKRLTLYSYVIMENHLHLTASSPDLSKEIADFKSFTARKIIDYLKNEKAQDVLAQLAQGKVDHKQDRAYQVWQEGSHPQLIQDEVMMRQKIEYIHNNPVKRGYVDDPTHWRYSSARNYAGLPGLLEVEQTW